MSQFRKLTDTMFASPQISVEDVDAAASEGVKLIICNRPDGEDHDQPGAEMIESAAERHGIAFRWIPVGGSGFGEPQVTAMTEALGSADGPVLAYCRSGTRSTLLWSLAQASEGRSPDDIAAAAQGAGYDISPIRPAVEMLSARARS